MCLSNVSRKEKKLLLVACNLALGWALALPTFPIISEQALREPGLIAMQHLNNGFQIWIEELAFRVSDPMLFVAAEFTASPQRVSDPQYGNDECENGW